MKLADVAYERPSDLLGALTLISDSTQDIRILAGGQSLLAALNFRLGEPDLLVDINRIDELKGISHKNGLIRIGALTRHVEVLQSPVIQQHLPLVAAAMRHVAHPAIRNRGTFGGSIALADPAAEMPACLLACDGTVVIASQQGERRIAADDFFLGLYETALQSGEIITAIEIPSGAGDHHFFGFKEFARRHGDYANAGVAITGSRFNAVEQARIVLFGIADRPVRAVTAEGLLNGQALSPESIETSANMVTEAISVFADLHTSEAMKRHLARVMMVRALQPLLESADLARP